MSPTFQVSSLDEETSNLSKAVVYEDISGVFRQMKSTTTTTTTTTTNMTTTTAATTTTTNLQPPNKEADQNSLVDCKVYLDARNSMNSDDLLRGDDLRTLDAPAVYQNTGLNTASGQTRRNEYSTQRCSDKPRNKLDIYSPNYNDIDSDI